MLHLWKPGTSECCEPPGGGGAVTSGGGAGLGQEAAYSDPAASTDYGAMNSLLAQLHSERVRAGARRPWVEEPDDEDEDCCEDW